VRRFAYPREVDIVGRVIGVTMLLVEAEQWTRIGEFNPVLFGKTGLDEYSIRVRPRYFAILEKRPSW